MAKFDQRGQTVQYQYNADTINIGAVQTPEECLLMVQALQTEVLKAIEAKAIQGDEAIDLEFYFKKAVLSAEQPQVKKQSLIQHLNNAKELVGGVNGLAIAIGEAVITIGVLF